MILSIVIPVYNERATLLPLLERVEKVVLPGAITGREIVLVDDCSNDGTRELIESLERPGLRKFFHEQNQGKGAALRTGFSQVSGDIVLIQDADLEYNPDEYALLLRPVLEQGADVVYGSRFLGGAPHRILYYWHSVGNKFLTVFSNMLSDLNFSDMETCYKVFKRGVIRQIEIEEDRFGFEPEITAKISALNRKQPLKIYEVGISYAGRTYEEGKKIGARDGFWALWCILKYNTSTAANFIKYSIIGVLVALFQVFLMIGIVEILEWHEGTKLEIAHGVSIEITIIMAFFLHCLVTWRCRKRPGYDWLKFFFIFHAATAFSFLMRVVLFHFLNGVVDWGYIGINFLGVLLAVVPNFYSYNFFLGMKGQGKVKS